MELRSSLDWDAIKTEINKLSKMLPAFSHDFYRLRINIESQVRELGNLEVDFRRTRSKSVKESCRKKVKQINEDLHQIKKIHLMSVLSR